MSEKRPTGERSPSTHSMRPILKKRHSLDPSASGSSHRPRSQSLELRRESTVVPPHQRSMDSHKPGEENIASSKTPLKALRMPDDSVGSPIDTLSDRGSILGEVHDEPKRLVESSDASSTEHMRVLVAEDDPVNSRIVKKRLEKVGHDVCLTVNGEECAGAFCDNPKDFDVVLMDMQVGIFTASSSPYAYWLYRCPSLTALPRRR